MELSPLRPYLKLAVPWQPCAMDISSEPAHMVTKVILWVYNLKEISEDLLYWNKRQKKIFWTHCLFLMVVLTGCPGEEKTKTRKNNLKQDFHNQFKALVRHLLD